MVDGRWSMPNVPSFMGRIRARATCIQGDVTFSGATEYFSVRQDSNTKVGDFTFNTLDEVKNKDIQISFLFNGDFYFNSLTPFTLQVMKKSSSFYLDDLTAEEKSGLNINSSNPNIVSVVGDKLVPYANGNAIITARLDGVVITKMVRVRLAGVDNDGIPDDYETSLTQTTP